MDDWSKFRWLGVEDCKDGKFGSELLCVNSAISPFPSLILDEIMSSGDWGEILVMGRMSPDFVTSSWRCFIMASRRSFSFWSCTSSWLTIWSWTLVWAVVLSSNVWAELRCLFKYWYNFVNWLTYNYDFVYSK